MPLISFPHTFHDGVGEVASGVQVMENLEALRTALEAMMAPGAPTARAEVAINALHDGPEPAKLQWVNIDFQLKTVSSFGIGASLYVDGQKVSTWFGSEHVEEYTASTGFWLAPGEEWEIVSESEAGGAHVQQLHVSYRTF